MKARKEGVCPVCKGTKRVPTTDDNHRGCCAGYDEKTDTSACRNCGFQYMFGRSSGMVPLRPDGTPCTHEYRSWNAGRCLTGYECEHCGDRYEIDSGD
jgi:hypothetical protein